VLAVPPQVGIRRVLGLIEVHLDAVQNPPEQVLRHDESRDRVGQRRQDRVVGVPVQRAFELLPPAGQFGSAMVERLGAVGDVVRAAGEGIQRLHAPPLVKRQKPKGPGKIRRRPPRHQAAGTKAGFQLRRHPLHHALATSRSFVSRPTVGRCDQTS
jgi:hypothetical protein